MAIEVINCSGLRESLAYQVWKQVQLIADVALVLVDGLCDNGDLSMLDYGKLAISSDSATIACTAADALKRTGGATPQDKTLGAAVDSDMLCLRVQSAVPVPAWPICAVDSAFFTQISEMSNWPIVVASPHFPPSREHGLVV